MAGLLRGDFGTSIITDKPVMRDILTFFPATMELALASILLAVVAGVWLGAISAVYRNQAVDHASRIFSIVGVSMPVFWIGLLLILLFYYYLGWLPSGGRHSLYAVPEHITGLVLLDSLLTRDWSGFRDGLLHLLLPACVLGYSATASITRIMRASMLDVLRLDYIRTARAKGIPRHLVVCRHALRNSLIPVVTVIGIRFGELLGGAVLTETIFSWPGLGRYLVNALLVLDYPAVTGGTLVIALIYSLANLAVDISYHALDPRM
jgi:peptide/nickel transport system permease protein